MKNDPYTAKYIPLSIVDFKIYDVGGFNPYLI